MLHAWYCNYVPCSMAETFTVPRREPNMVILLNGHSIEWLYKSVAYITRKLSDLIREKFFVFDCALDDSIISVLSPKRDIYTTPLHSQGRAPSRKTVRARDWEQWNETVSSEHDGTTGLVNSQELWMPAQDLHKVKPFIIPAWRRNDFTRPLS